MIYIDTSALYALLDRCDRRHPQARDAWFEWSAVKEQFVTSNYVVVESLSLIRHRLGVEAARRFQVDFTPVLHIHWITPDLHAAGVAQLLADTRRELSLVDCTSFAVMRALNLADAFAFDQHFVEQGFRCLP